MVIQGGVRGDHIEVPVRPHLHLLEDCVLHPVSLLEAVDQALGRAALAKVADVSHREGGGLGGGGGLRGLPFCWARRLG